MPSYIFNALMVTFNTCLFTCWLTSHCMTPTVYGQQSYKKRLEPVKNLNESPPDFMWKVKMSECLCKYLCQYYLISNLASVRLVSDSDRAEKEEGLRRIWQSFNICERGIFPSLRSAQISRVHCCYWSFLVVSMSGKHDMCCCSEDYSDWYLFFKRQFAAHVSSSFQRLWQLQPGTVQQAQAVWWVIEQHKWNVSETLKINS